MRALLRAEKAKAGTWQALAEAYGFQAPYLHRVAFGKQNVTDDIARRLGFRRVERVEFVALREEVKPDDL